MDVYVSVIIPAYNCEKYVRETVESVLNQTFTNFELLVVDDGSTDNLKALIDEYIVRDKRIRYIYQQNRGVSAARNNGFNQSRGAYIAFLDSDDVWLPDNLALKIQRLDREPNVGLVHSNGMVIDEHSRNTQTTLIGAEGAVLDAMLLWDGTQVPGPSSILVKRAVLNSVGLFDEGLSTAADKDLFVRIASQFDIARVNRVTWYYRIHANNMHKNIAVMEKDILRLYEKARELRLFKDKAFERRCFAAMYLILAASWAGDGRDVKRSLPFLLLAVRNNPSVIVSVLGRALKRWVLK